MRRISLTLLIAGALAAAGCGVHSPPHPELRQELQRLRVEQRELRERMERLERRLSATSRPAPEARPRATRGRDTAPEHLVRGLLEAYRRLLEAGDRSRIREELYRGIVPPDDSRYLDLWVERTTDLEVELGVTSLNVEADRVTAGTEQHMRFRLARTGQRRDVRLRVTMSFERLDDGEWRLARVVPRL